MYMCIYIYIYTLHKIIHISMCMCMCMCMCNYVYVYVYVYVCIYACITSPRRRLGTPRRPRWSYPPRSRAGRCWPSRPLLGALSLACTFFVARSSLLLRELVFLRLLVLFCLREQSCNKSGDAKRVFASSPKPGLYGQLLDVCCSVGVGSAGDVHTQRCIPGCDFEAHTTYVKAALFRGA